MNLIVNNKGDLNNFTLISNNKGASNTTSIITNNPSYNITYLVVGGGGGGTDISYTFPGGGAGGVLYGNTSIFKKDILTITVGSGGNINTNGQSSSIKIGSNYIALSAVGGGSIGNSGGSGS